MPTDQLYLLGLAIGLLSAIPVAALIWVAESEKFAGLRKKFAVLTRRFLPFAVIDPFERVYGSESVALANKKARNEAIEAGKRHRKAL